MAQTRLVRLNGEHGPAAWVPLSDGDELAACNQLPRAWNDIVRRRLGGATIEQCYRMQSKLSFEEFREGLAVAFAIYDKYLWAVAEHRAKQIIAQRQLTRPAGRGVVL